MGKLTCPFGCPAETFVVLKGYLKHVQDYHGDSRVTCNFGSCRRKYASFKSFRNHVYDYHRSAKSTSMIHNGGEDMSQDAQDCSMSIEEYEELEEVTEQPGYREDLKKKAALWILKLRENRKLPVSTVLEIMADVQELYSFLLRSLYAEMKGTVSADEALSAINDASEYEIFDDLKTSYDQEKYFKENFNFVEPEEITLGSNMIPLGRGRSRKIRQKRDTFIHIPITETVKSLHRMGQLPPQVVQSCDNIHVDPIKDISDGAVAKDNAMLRDPEALKLVLYYDDIEICNPLGSKKKKHKLGMFYFTFGNTSSLQRSKLSSIHLVAIARTALLKKYSMNKIIQPIVKELKTLEQGLDLGGGDIIKGTVACISADNPASSALAGFKEGALAHHPCRHCMITSDEMSSKMMEGECILRNRVMHEEQCNEIENAVDKKMHGELSKAYGVNFRSELLSLAHCDITRGALIPDLLHDILEGMLPMEVQALLKHLILEQNYLSLDELNHFIMYFELGYMEIKNRPTTINLKDVKLVQSASQMWLLGRLLPLMIGSYVPEDDEHWLNFLLLLKIMDYLFSPVTSEGDCAYLKVLIAEHHRNFCHLYPNINVTPKMHYMIHMPRIMLYFGPLVKHWTMRFEAKHQYFKKLSQRVNNFKNVAKSLSKRHQLMSLYEMLSPRPSLEIGPVIGLLNNADIGGNADGSNTLRKYQYVTINGTLIKESCLILIKDSGTCTFPKFLMVKSIVADDGEVKFIGLVYKTHYFSTHYHCYVIYETAETEVLYELDERHPYPMHFRYIPELKTPSLNSYTNI